jgi:ribosomal protein S18 acetylase RimI-like enzyme
VNAVRELGPGDEQVLRRLSAESAAFDVEGAEPRPREPLSGEAARRFLSDPGTHLFVAFERDEPVGMLLAYDLLRRHCDERMAHVYELGVRRDRRRRGVGRRLFEAFRARCRASGIRAAYVLTESSNEEAIAFYASVGGRRPDPDTIEIDFEL